MGGFGAGVNETPFGGTIHCGARVVTRCLVGHQPLQLIEEVLDPHQLGSHGLGRLGQQHQVRKFWTKKGRTGRRISIPCPGERPQWQGRGPWPVLTSPSRKRTGRYLNRNSKSDSTATLAFGLASALAFA